MNTKNILLIILAFTAFSLALRAQPLPEQLLQSRNRHCGIDNEESFWDQPVRVKPKSPKRDIHFLPPEKAIRYYYPDFENPAVELTYKYDDQQALETVLWKPLKTGYSAIRSEYNNTLTIAGLDMRDTVTYYSDVAMTKPTRRRYNNWKLYEVSAVDSFYYEQVEQRWNETTNRWGNFSKHYTGFIDTVMWTMNRSVSYNGDGADGWTLIFSTVDDPIFYNEQGFVTGSLRYLYASDRTFKYIYTLDEDGSVRSDSIYLLQPEGDVLWYTSEYEWLEWHGFGDVRPLFGVSGADGLYYEHPWMQKRNKQTLQTHYMYHYGEKLFTVQHKTYWNTGPHYSHIDSVFVNNGDYTYENRYLANIDEHRYDSYGNYNLCKSISFEKPDSTGYQALAGVATYSYHHYYTDYGYGIGCDSIASWTVGLSTIVPQMIDSFLNAAEKVVRYAVVGTSEYPQQAQALRVAPNPASDKVLITASEAIQTLSVYDLAGKLVKTKKTPENDQIVFDLGTLPKGIYVVRAQLKSGTLQMGKLVRK